PHSPFASLLPFTFPLPPRSTLFPYTTLFRSTLSRPTWHKTGRQSGADRSGAAADAEDRGQSRGAAHRGVRQYPRRMPCQPLAVRSEEHTSELQSRGHLVCRLLLEKKNQQTSD